MLIDVKNELFCNLFDEEKKLRMADGRLYTKGELVLSIFLCKRLGALLAILFFLNFLRVLSSLVVSLGTAPNTCKPKVSCQGKRCIPGRCRQM